VALEDALPGRVCRMDFPYRKAGKKLPDKEPVLLQSIVDEAASMHFGPVILGGRSMGGRICSIAAARGLVNARALVLICYPLHPPGKPDRLRTDHFPDLHLPCLFISGTSDAFGTPDELETATASIPGQVTHHWIERADHSLKRHDQAIAHIAAEWIVNLG
jgi:uncharacterized protein